MEDVETAIRWVKAYAADYNADPKRIALIGESAGGHLVSLVAVRAKPDTRVAAVVPFYSPNDLELQARNNLRTPAWATALFGTTTMDDAATKVIRDASPSTHITAGLPPFLLVHGTDDTRVAVDQSRQFQVKLQALGNPCDLLLVQGVGHGMVTWEKANTRYKTQLFEWLLKTMQ